MLVTDFTQKARAEICSSDSIEAALSQVGLGTERHRHSTLPRTGMSLVELMGTHGVETALDLQLMQSVEAAELMESLRSSGLAVGARAKLRLLIGDPMATQPVVDGRADRKQNFGSQSQTVTVLDRARRARLQEAIAGGGPSFESIAIVVSVLLGVAGYMVQVSTDTIFFCA